MDPAMTTVLPDVGHKEKSNGDVVLGDFTIVSLGTWYHDGGKHVALKNHSSIVEKGREKYRVA